ncbi:hypothetical protein ACFL0F_00545 [Patescibacteria group bacterium]
MKTRLLVIMMFVALLIAFLVDGNQVRGVSVETGGAKLTDISDITVPTGLVSYSFDEIWPHVECEDVHQSVLWVYDDNDQSSDAGWVGLSAKVPLITYFETDGECEVVGILPSRAVRYHGITGGYAEAFCGTTVKFAIALYELSKANNCNVPPVIIPTDFHGNITTSTPVQTANKLK